MRTFYSITKLYQEWDANYSYIHFCRKAVNQTAIIKLTNHLDTMGNSLNQLASIADKKILIKGAKEPVGLRRTVLIKNQLIYMKKMNQEMVNVMSHKSAVARLMWQFGVCVGLKHKL